MAKRHSNNGSAVPAVAYLRMSSDKQDASIPEQREVVGRYAVANGYKLLTEYADEGISGDRTEKRKAFQRMIADAGREKFRAILVYDSSRFGRFDSLEAGYWLKPLRDAGVVIVTTDKGVIDLDDFAGRIVHAVETEAKHQFLRDLSRNTTRGLLAKAKAGKIDGQHCPFGYDRIVVDENGKRQQRILRGDKFAKPKSWSVALVPNDEEAATVRWLFTTYATTDSGLRRLADELNARGVAGPTGGPWYAASIREILKNTKYVGRYAFAQRRKGKYHHARIDDVQPRSRAEVIKGAPLVAFNPQEAWITREHAHEALIDKATFDVVQAKLDQRKRSANPGYRTHTRQNSDAFFLTGLVYCGRCGCRMYGSHCNGKPKFSCSTYHRCGRQNEAGCRCHIADQAVLLDVILRKLQSSVLLCKNRERLEAELRRQLSIKGKPDQRTAARLRRQLCNADKQITTAADRLLTAPADLLDVLTPRLRQMKADRQRIAEELKNVEHDAKPKNVDAVIKSLTDKLWSLADELMKAPPDRLRELLKLLVERIDLSFEHEGERRSKLQSGVITLRSDSAIFNCVKSTNKV